MAKLLKKEFNIILTRGDTYSLDFDVSNLTSTDLTEAYMTCKEKNNPSGTALFCKKLNSGITKITSGKYKVSLTRADTINLEIEEKYMYDIEIKYGNEIKTIVSGTLKLMQDYTTPADENSDEESGT